MDEALDPSHAARNIRGFRKLSNWTTTELAEKANVSRTTIWQAERGVRVRGSSLSRIADALNVHLDQLESALPTLKPPQNSYQVHHPGQELWYIFPGADSRRAVPADNIDQIQDSKERARLGRTGLVSIFISALSFVMSKGPGITYIEVYGAHDITLNSHIYMDAVLNCVRGEVKVAIAGDEIVMRVGSAIGLSTETEFHVEPIHPLGKNDLPPLLLWAGANRGGTVIQGW